MPVAVERKLTASPALAVTFAGWRVTVGRIPTVKPAQTDAVLTFAMSYAARKHIPVVYADVGADQAA